MAREGLANCKNSCLPRGGDAPRPRSFTAFNSWHRFFKGVFERKNISLVFDLMKAWWDFSYPSVGEYKGEEAWLVLGEELVCIRGLHVKRGFHYLLQFGVFWVDGLVRVTVGIPFLVTQL